MPRRTEEDLCQEAIEVFLLELHAEGHPSEDIEAKRIALRGNVGPDSPLVHRMLEAKFPWYVRKLGEAYEEAKQAYYNGQD